MVTTPAFNGEKTLELHSLPKFRLPETREDFAAIIPILIGGPEFSSCLGDLSVTDPTRYEEILRTFKRLREIDQILPQEITTMNNGDWREGIRLIRKVLDLFGAREELIDERKSVVAQARETLGSGMDYIANGARQAISRLGRK